jgi:hypothetical protein
VRRTRHQKSREDEGKAHLARLRADADRLSDLKYLKRTGSSTRFALDRALLALEERLSGPQAGPAVDAALNLVLSASDYYEIFLAVEALPALAPKLTEAQAQEAFGRLLSLGSQRSGSSGLGKGTCGAFASGT